MIDTKELRRLAQAATPGGWYVARGNYVYGCKDVTDGEEEWHPVIACADDDEPVNYEGNAAFIAAANPTAILELLDRLEAAESALSNLGVTPEEAREGLARHKATLARLEAAEAEALEQARLNGIGAERELALMAKLEAAEKELVELRLGISKQQSLTDAAQQLAEATRRRADKLSAKVEQMEKQEPVAFVDYKIGNCFRWAEYLGWQKIKDGTRLYTLPGAKGEEK